MKQLLTLISLFFVLSVNAQTITYTIKQGDTLYSIARDNDLSINDIFKANEVLGFSPDNILQGNKIFLPKTVNETFDDICYSRVGLYQFSLYESHKEISNACIDTLQNFINFDEINSSNMSYAANLYLINKVIFNLDFKEIDNYLNDANSWKSFWLKNSQKEFDILLDAANQNNLETVYSTIYLLEDSFNSYLKDVQLKQVRDKTTSPSDMKLACKNLILNPEINSYDLKLHFYQECSDNLYDAKDNDYIKYDNFLEDLIFSNDSKIIKLFELYAVVAMSYRRLNSNDSDGAYEITNKYVKAKCKECDNAIDLYNKFIQLNKEEYYSNYLENVLLYLILNNTSAMYEVFGILPEDIIEDRKEIFERLKDLMEEDPYAEDVYTAYLSDTALKIISWRECDIAKDYLDLAIKDYQSGRWDNSNEDYFDEPLYMAACYIKSALTLSKTRQEILDNLNKAKAYIEISLDAKEELSITNPIKITLLNVIQSFVMINDEIFNTGLDLNDIELPQQLQNFLLNISETLKEEDIYDFSGDIENYELLTSLYIPLYKLIDGAEWVDISKMIDPVTLIQMKDKFFVNSKLVNLKIEAKNENLVSIQKKLINNNQKIKNINNEELEYKEMLALYKENTFLIEEIFSLNENLEKLTTTKIETIESIQNSLHENEYAYFFVPSPISSKIFLIGKDSYNYWNRSSNDLLQPVIITFLESIDPNKNYDFELAKLLGDALFPMFNDDLNLIEKGSTIYIYTDDFIGFHPGILVKSYNESESISEYERLISAEWFIKDFNFTTKLNFENKHEVDNAKPFLGIGNSTSYNWVGLPNLNEVDSEITNLALTSFANRDDILLGANATKELFLSKLKENYSRVVISTHSVPPDWQGLLDEPALVFNSKNGDYFLTPSEIINKEINSDMVVLSSCNASIDGFDDLYKSFLIAGSKSVVHSNWNLESKYAKEFTTSFFKELWLNDKNKHEAIRSVSLKFLNDYSNQRYAHPAYWGNFSIVYSSVN